MSYRIKIETKSMLEFTNPAFTALVGSVIGAFFTLFAAVLVTKGQERVARINADKDLRIHADKMTNSRLTEDVTARRGKLSELHQILSRVEFENSQTMSYMSAEENLEIPVFRQRYRELCSMMASALSIVDIYYPEMSQSMLLVYGKANIFWGQQEHLLRTPSQDRKAWQERHAAVVETAHKIRDLTSAMQENVQAEARDLARSLALPNRR
ncbi:hypothetical protein D5038_19860 [Verminephrobacter aporrectodeae subsp. tuberculatae]|uniref:hypothetical protein n=1 Tax=Verminephrobacter aporrectodeae TaxID=1110389 RepID=UPI000496CE9F|nr:hypothetical protein [Verminephrobacter aporrectodeae]MCW5258516.1 hypothetical protein [Verminephrobacter aporrectodeae subsp. tuberculatae]MCW8208519.1 hypothetical protein [Verminephrobacter aporrectodeae subsp. tuberculatae]